MQTHDRQPRRLHTALQHMQDRLARLRLASHLPAASSISDAGNRTMLSLEVIIKVSAEQMEESARKGWAVLSVLPARPYSFSEEAALAVSGTPVEVLDMLSDAGLLEAVSPARYTFHQTIADYGRAQLSTQAQQEALKRLIAYAQQYAEKHLTNDSALMQETNILMTALERCHQSGADMETTNYLTPGFPEQKEQHKAWIEQGTRRPSISYRAI